MTKYDRKRDRIIYENKLEKKRMEKFTKRSQKHFRYILNGCLGLRQKRIAILSLLHYMEYGPMSSTCYRRFQEEFAKELKRNLHCTWQLAENYADDIFSLLKTLNLFSISPDSERDKRINGKLRDKFWKVSFGKRWKKASARTGL